MTSDAELRPVRSEPPALERHGRAPVLLALLVLPGLSTAAFLVATAASDGGTGTWPRATAATFEVALLAVPALATVAAGARRHASISTTMLLALASAALALVFRVVAAIVAFAGCGSSCSL